MQKVFTEQGDFKATEAAEAWCKEQGISVGTMQRNSPRGLKRGECIIAKWRNLDNKDHKLLDGKMTGDPRHGPITVEIS